MSAGLAGLVILVAAVSILQNLRGRHGLPPGISTRAYYTTEDQLTGQEAIDALFVDDVNKAPPFDHNGKPAYLAIVYQCDNGRTKWVNCLKRYTPEMRRRVQAVMDAWVAAGHSVLADTKDFDGSGTELKLPGDNPWVRSRDPAFQTVQACHLPAGADMSDLNFCVP